MSKPISGNCNVPLDLQVDPSLKNYLHELRFNHLDGVRIVRSFIMEQATPFVVYKKYKSI